MAWLRRLLPALWDCQRNLSKAQSRPCHFPTPNLALSPHGPQDKVRALRLASKSSTVWTLLPSPGCCPAALSLTTHALAILNNWPPTHGVGVPKGLPKLLLLLAATLPRPPPCTPTHSAPLPQLLPIFKSQPEKPFHLYRQTRPLLPSCPPWELHAPIQSSFTSHHVTSISVCLSFMPVGELLDGRECVSRSSLHMNSRHSARLRVDAQ